MKRFIALSSLMLLCSFPCSSKYTSAQYDYSSSATGQIVYVTPNGKKYHSSTNCISLSRSKKVSKLDISDAKYKGYTPCKICFD